ncbi:MAG: PDZ domain-containing protein [Vicinamibacterales bacterium]
MLPNEPQSAPERSAEAERPAGPRSAWWSRETRLLLMTIVLSVGVLLVLARFRFPAEEARAEVPQLPLERLATRATYDELAAIVERLDRRIEPSMVVLRVRPGNGAPARTLRQIIQHGDPAVPSTGYVPAIRVRPDVALVMLDPGTTVLGVMGDDEAVPFIVAADPVRRLALVRVPGPADPMLWPWQAAQNVVVPRYVAAVEGSRGGQTLRPIFLGRADRFEEPHWESPLLVLSSAPITTEGAFVFSLEGLLIGMVVEEAGVQAVVPATTLEAAANDLLESGSPTVTDFGLAIQPLTAAVAQAHGVTSGVVVAAVEPGSLADGHLEPGDLVQAVGGRPAVNPDAVLLLLAQTRPGQTVEVGVRRGQETMTIPLAVPEAAPRDEREQGDDGAPGPDPQAPA